MSAVFDSHEVTTEEINDERGPAIVVSGSLASGFTGFGTFNTVNSAIKWMNEQKQENLLYPTVVVLINPLNMLFGDFVLVGTVGLARPYLFFGPFDSPDTAKQVAAAVSQSTDVPIMFDIMPVSKEQKEAEEDVESQHDNNV